jgi:hypothetical protein
MSRLRERGGRAVGRAAPATGRASTLPNPVGVRRRGRCGAPPGRPPACPSPRRKTECAPGRGRLAPSAPTTWGRGGSAAPLLGAPSARGALAATAGAAAPSACPTACDRGTASAWVPRCRPARASWCEAPIALRPAHLASRGPSLALRRHAWLLCEFRVARSAATARGLRGFAARGAGHGRPPAARMQARRRRGAVQPPQRCSPCRRPGWLGTAQTALRTHLMPPWRPAGAPGAMLSTRVPKAKPNIATEDPARRP